MDSSVQNNNEREQLGKRIAKANMKVPGRSLHHAIKNLDIIPDDSVSVMDKPLINPKEVNYGDSQSSISADSSIAGKVNPVMANFYQERERIKKKQAERLRMIHS